MELRQLGPIDRIGRQSECLLAQRNPASAPRARLIQGTADSLRVVQALRAQDTQRRLGIRVEPNMQGTRHNQQVYYISCYASSSRNTYCKIPP
jgi:hypothetical protein